MEQKEIVKDAKTVREVKEKLTMTSILIPLKWGRPIQYLQMPREEAMEGC